MHFNTIVGLLVAGFVWSCIQGTSSENYKTENSYIPNPIDQKSLQIENGINRGVSYSDSKERDFNLRYIPIKIKNDSTVSIHLQLVFSNEYYYAQTSTIEQFRIIPLPEEWAMDGVGVTEKMMDELPKYIDSPVLNETIEPGEEFRLAIGTLYSRPPKFSGVLPNALFLPDNGKDYDDCPRLTDMFQSINAKQILGLKLKFGDDCRIISCGQIVYSNAK